MKCDTISSTLENIKRAISNNIFIGLLVQENPEVIHMNVTYSNPVYQLHIECSEVR